MGFCMGVRRAMQAIEEILESPVPRPITTYGPLIHNERVLSDLEKRGIGRIDSIEDFTGGSVILRTHGVRPLDTQRFKEAGAQVVDLTCPRVLKSQNMVAEAHRKGESVILVGDKNHGEIVAIEGAAPGCAIIRTVEEAEDVQMDGDVLVVAQTTLLKDEYLAIGEILKRRNPSAEIAMTLCPATVQRQLALAELAGRVDGILVIGGKNSANTGKLFQQARETGLPSWHIEGSGDIPEVVYSLDRVGITAGASTPDWIIEEVEESLKRRSV